MFLCHSLPVCLVNIAVPGLDMPVSISRDWYWGRGGGAIYCLSSMRPCVFRKSSVCALVIEDRVGSYLCLCSPLQNHPRTQKARRTMKRRVLNSASEKTELTTTTHQTLLNYLKWSITAPMGRAQGASAPHELLKWSQIEYKCELLKKGDCFCFVFFAVKGIGLGCSSRVRRNPANCTFICTGITCNATKFGKVYFLPYYISLKKNSTSTEKYIIFEGKWTV